MYSCDLVLQGSISFLNSALRFYWNFLKTEGLMMAHNKSKHVACWTQMLLCLAVKRKICTCECRVVRQNLENICYLPNVNELEYIYFQFPNKFHPPHGAAAPNGPEPHHRRFTITLDRTSLYVWSARRRDLYLTTQNTHKRQISIGPAEFEPTIPANERPQTHGLDRPATGISYQTLIAKN